MAPRDLLLLFLLSAVWGASFILIKISGASFPPAWIALLRLAFGTSVLAVAMRIRRAPAPPRSMFPSLLALAVLNNAVPFTLIAWGEHTIPSGVASILNATTTLWSLIFSFAIAGTSRSWKTIGGVVIGFAGVGIAVFSAGQHPGAIRAEGVILVALGALSYAAATALAKAKLRNLNPLGFATTQLAVATALMIPVALLGPAPSAVTTQSIAAIATLGILGTGVAYLGYYQLLARVSAVQVQAVTYILPVWGLFWGFLAGEPIGWLAAVGVGVVLAGLALLQR